MKERILSENGYEIPCINKLVGNEEIVVIISHGLGSSKKSTTVLALMEKMEDYKIGTFAYDFPGHGDSPVDGESFLISNCIKDLATVEKQVRKLSKSAEIVYFSSSFGAYINLLYLAGKGNPNCKSFLRSAAVDMPGIIKKGETKELAEQLDRSGYFTINLGSLRPLKITREFCLELESNNLFKKDFYNAGNIYMVHGSLDESAPLADAKRFAEKFGAQLTVVENGHHSLMGPGHMDFVLDKAVEFFKGDKR